MYQLQHQYQALQQQCRALEQHQLAHQWTQPGNPVASGPLPVGAQLSGLEAVLPAQPSPQPQAAPPTAAPLHTSSVPAGSGSPASDSSASPPSTGTPNLDAFVVGEKVFPGFSRPAAETGAAAGTESTLSSVSDGSVLPGRRIIGSEPRLIPPRQPPPENPEDREVCRYGAKCRMFVMHDRDHIARKKHLDPDGKYIG